MVRLIKAECNNPYPLCVHYGFLIGDVVIHNTPDKTNISGGNIITEKWIDFLASRNIYEIEDTTLKESDVWEYYEKNKTKKFSPITFNCEQFANDVLIGVKKSSILSRTLFLLGLGYFALKKLKKNQK